MLVHCGTNMTIDYINIDLTDRENKEQYINQVTLNFKSCLIKKNPPTNR